MLIVAVMMEHCSFYKQQAWRLMFAARVLHDDMFRVVGAYLGIFFVK